MAHDIPLRCECGTLAGVALGVAPSTGCRVVCYCNDCQAFARFLARPGITDEWGGTDIFQIAPARVRLTAGADALSCVRLSEKGMHRWYCGECKTPVGNTLSPGIPFVGLIHSFMDHRADGRERDTALGKPLGYVQTKFAVGDLSSRPQGTLPLRVIARSVRLLGTAWLSGAGSPSAFFDDRTHLPRATPRVLRPDERRGL
jgi:hypothetical protein